MTSKRQSIITEIKTQLQTILISNGYNTDAGSRVYVDRSVFGDNEIFPLINLDEQEDSVEEYSYSKIGGKMRINLPISVEAVNTCSPLDPSGKGHELIEDIKKALLNYNYSSNIKQINYLSSSIQQHENGSGYVNISVNAEIIYIETIGNPQE